MSPLVIAFVTSLTALTAAVVTPLVSLLVARMQVKAAVISNNRERWIETLRDGIAEYVALLLTASIVKQGVESDPMKAVSERSDLRQTVERIVMTKNKILLMVSPREQGYVELRAKIEASYELLSAGRPIDLSIVRSHADDITRVGGDVLRAEWARVKRGD